MTNLSPKTTIRCLAVAALSAALCLLSISPAMAASRVPRLKHVWVVVLENHSDGQILGNPQAPFLNKMARRHGLATHYYSLSHPSLPNYLAMISGSTHGCGSDTCSPGYGGPLLTRQLRQHGLSWRGYFQGLPGIGYTGGDRGSYVRHHNPFVYFPAITSSHQARHNIQPFKRFARSLGRHTPNFSLVVPDNAYNMHTGSIASSDRFLHYWIPKIMNSRAFHRRGAIFITFDEGHNDSHGCCVRGVHGGRTVLISITPQHRRLRVNHAYSAYSLLKTIERGFGLSAVGQSNGVPALRGFWR